MKQTMKYLSFTGNETKVILFIITVLISGFSVKYIKYLSENRNKSYFDYSKTEELFLELSKSTMDYHSTDTYKKNISGINSSLNNNSKKILISEDSVNSKVKKSKKEELLKPKSININTATKEILITLPGVGESTAEKIIKYREAHNGFKKIEHIMKVKGIGKKKFEKLKDYIYIE